MFWIGGCLWEVVAYERWSHMEVRRISFKSLIELLSSLLFLSTLMFVNGNETEYK